ncbi:MAG: Nitrate reductase gamma subunit [candidate division BRC1 bacterium ADurb.BinA364]|nr:MAG: Nitrate reductase gamma subunit [candidate division BRC1 bacterium ADurb.BinA364]
MIVFRFLFGVLIPYATLAVFAIGFVYRIVQWAKSPVPFRITTTCGQQKSMGWIRHQPLESPSNWLGVVGRMFLEVFFMRSLFRNTRTELSADGKLTYGTSLWLWIGAMAFHWSLLVILLRHLRFFTDPMPFFLPILETLDGFFQVGAPSIYISSFAILAALGYLLARRIVSPQIKAISLPGDYFALGLLLAIVLTGMAMRYTPIRADIAGVKELGYGLATFQPVAPKHLGLAFYLHLLLVCALLAYFPFSKLMHMGGVFLSPTRNMPNNSRAVRHINPWNPEVKAHTYAEWEDEFRDKIKGAGLPLEKDA